MNTNFLNLKTRVMARIYLEYVKNTVVERPDYFIFFLFIVTSFVLVSIHDVLNNIPKNNMSSTFNFFMIALRDTSWIIQVFVAGFFARVIFSGVKLTYKNLSNRRWSLIKLRY